MKHTWEVSSVLAQVAEGRRGRKQGSSTAVEFQAGGVSAWVGGAPPPSPPPAATARLLLWSVQVGVPGVSWEHWRLPALEGRSVPYCFRNQETVVSPHLTSANQSSMRAVHHSLFPLLEPGDIPALLQVPNALVVILLGDKVAIGPQRDLVVLSV